MVLLFYNRKQWTNLNNITTVIANTDIGTTTTAVKQPVKNWPGSEVSNHFVSTCRPDIVQPAPVHV